MPGKEISPGISACRARPLREEGDEPDCWARAVSDWASACGAAGRWVQGRGRVPCSRAERGELQRVVGGPKRAEPGGSAGEAGERAGCGERGRGPCSVELGCSAGSGEGLGCLSGFGPGLVGLLGLDFLNLFYFYFLSLFLFYSSSNKSI